MKKKILLVISIILLTCACSNGSLKNINVKKLETKLKNKETFVLLLTDEEKGKTLKNTLSIISKENKLNSVYINTEKLNDNDLKSLKKLFSFDETNIIIFVKNGKEETTLSRIDDIYITKANLLEQIKNQDYIK